MKKVYTDAELKFLLKKPNVMSCSFIAYRNWILANFLISRGQRKKTVINLKIKDLDFENGRMILKVVNKRKLKALPPAPKITEVLSEYISHRKGDKKYNQSRGVEQSSIYAFRHKFAKKYLHWWR